MYTSAEVFQFSQYEDKILELIEHRNNFTSSDFDSALSAIIMTIYNHQ
jgi:hypothetical protein